MITTVLFVLSAALISLFQTGSALLLGVDAQGFALAPPGNDPIAYFLQLFFFGLTLCAARRIDIPGALIIAMSFHVVQLSITRILLGGVSWIESGVTVTFVEPDAIILVLAHIIVSGLIFLALRMWLSKRTAATTT